MNSFCEIFFVSQMDCFYIYLQLLQFVVQARKHFTAAVVKRWLKFYVNWKQIRTMSHSIGSLMHQQRNFSIYQRRKYFPSVIMRWPNTHRWQSTWVYYTLHTELIAHKHVYKCMKTETAKRRNLKEMCFYSIKYEHFQQQIIHFTSSHQIKLIYGPNHKIILPEKLFG